MGQQFFRTVRAEFGEGGKNAEGSGKAILIANDPDTQSLRVAFSVERDRLPWPNNAELKVWNLSETTRGKLTGAGSVVARIAAGYDGQTDQIFFGTLDIVEHEKDGPDWVTHMSASDCGGKIKKTRVSKSFGKGVLVRDVIKEILKTLDLGEGNLKDFAFDSDMLRPLGHGGSLHGNAVEELTHFLRSAGLEFSIQDGKIQLVKIGKGVPNTRGPLLSPSTGLVGSAHLVREQPNDMTRTKRPEKGTVKAALSGEDKDETILTVEGRCLLNHALVPGVPFKIQSETVNGDFVCVAMKHVGDTHGADWCTDFKGIPLADA